MEQVDSHIFSDIFMLRNNKKKSNEIFKTLESLTTKQ